MKLPPPDSDGDGPNLTPLIDVVFLLLIFFLIASRFEEQEKEIKTRTLPKVFQAQPLASGTKEIVVNISRKGEFSIDGTKYTGRELQTILNIASKNNPGRRKVKIRADEDVKFRYPAFVMGVCEGAKPEKLDHYVTVREKDGGS